MVMLIGLCSKNSILIVEFAQNLRDQGKPIIEAAVEASHLRLRPILMTAFSFVLGVIPLAMASGAGAAARRSLGTTVLGGMLVSTILSLIVTPILYVTFQQMREWFSPPPKQEDKKEKEKREEKQQEESKEESKEEENDGKEKSEEKKEKE